MNNNEKYKISVIVPVYNKEKYIRQCIESLINQTLKEIEIIIVNDGSTDNSKKIIEEYVKRNKNIKYVEQENQGVIQTRINGYKEATGEYIGWVDADDFVKLEMFEKMYYLAEKNNSEVVICNYAFFPDKITTKTKWFNEYKGKVDWKFVNRNTIECNKIVKKSLLDSVEITNLFEKIGEAAYTMVLINTDKIVTTNEELYNYRVGHKSFSTDYTNINWFEKNVKMAIGKRELINNTKLEKKWAEFFDYRISYNYILMLIIAAYNGERELFYKYKKRLKDMNFYKTKNKKEYIKHDLGNLKGFVFYKIIPKNYWVSRIIAKIILSR